MTIVDNCDIILSCIVSRESDSRRSVRPLPLTESDGITMLKKTMHPQKTCIISRIFGTIPTHADYLTGIAFL